jgi:pantetheine-phosphate adenylyltransferase
MKIGVFTGSFDPFTIGHDDIVKRTLPLFDQIVIGIGVNERKQYRQTKEERVSAIAKVYANEPKIVVKAYSDLTVDFAKREKASYIIKGIRSIKDFEYERELADVNKQLGGIDTVLLVSEPGYSSVSSSVVRELMRYGKDVSELLPGK